MVVAAVPLQELLTNCVNVFARIRNRTLDRFQFFSRKQKQDETLKQFWNILTGLASRCALGDQTNSLVLDVFILNMNNTTVQEKLCTEPKDTPEEALRFAVAFEEGIQRQRSYGTGLVEKTPKIKSEPVMTIKESKQCFRCGRQFDKDHLRKCPAKGNKCNFCGSIGHFTKVCRKAAQCKVPAEQLGERRKMQRVNNIEQDSASASSDTDADRVVLQVNGYAENNPPIMMKGTINKKAFSTMIDSGSPITIFTQSDIKNILQQELLFAKPMPNNEKYVDFNNKPLNLLGYIIVTVKVGQKTIKGARLIITRDGGRSLIGRDWMSQLNYTLASNTPSEYHSSILLVNEQTNDIATLLSRFPKAFTGHGKVKEHQIQIEFLSDTTTSQQKGRRIPLQLQTAVDAELRRLLEAGHIKRVDSIRDDVFIQPTVITVKKDRSVKIALDARALNAAIRKDKYPMPNLDHLIDQIAEILHTDNGEVWFTTLDLQYAYGQIPLHPNTAKHSNFQIIGGEMSGTYCFQTGYYGLTTMPTEFQRIMDSVLAKLKNVFSFIDDILIVTRGNHENHLEKVQEVIRTLDKVGFRLKAEKCQVAKHEIDWLGYKFSEKGIKPINSKIQGISDKLRPTSLKQLRSFMGAINQLNRFIPNLAQLCAPLRPLLKKDQTWKWNQEHETTFHPNKRSITKNY